MMPLERNKMLGITDHATRRLRGDLIHVFKWINQDSFFVPSSITHTRGHSRKLCLEFARTNLRKHSFTVRTVNAWNSLPENVVAAQV